MSTNWAMQLCDWDVLAVDERGQPTNGVSEPSLCGLRVEVCRNWINLCGSSVWRLGSLSPEPVVSTIVEGELTFLDVSLLACRGPRDGVYFSAWFLVSDKPVGLSGLSCYGWEGNTYTGAGPAEVDFLQRKLTEWSDRQLMPVELSRMPSQLLRFNQGDAHLLRLAKLPIDSTPVGEAKPPLPLEYGKIVAPLITPSPI